MRTAAPAFIVFLCACAGQAQTPPPILDVHLHAEPVSKWDGVELPVAVCAPFDEWQPWAQIANELHAIVEALNLSGPLILVGHSMGGIHVLRYTTLYPEHVTGVVILDTPPPRFEERRLTLLTLEEREARARVLRRGLADAPETVRLEREGAQSPSEWNFSTFPRAMPLAVVVADSQNFGDLGSQAAHRRLWLEGSQAWLDLSTNARLTIVPRSCSASFVR